MPMVALVQPVFDCLFRLAQPDALKNEEEVKYHISNFIITTASLYECFMTNTDTRELI